MQRDTCAVGNQCSFERFSSGEHMRLEEGRLSRAGRNLLEKTFTALTLQTAPLRAGPMVSGLVGAGVYEQTPVLAAKRDKPRSPPARAEVLGASTPVIAHQVEPWRRNQGSDQFAQLGAQSARWVGDRPTGLTQYHHMSTEGVLHIPRAEILNAALPVEPRPPMAVRCT